MYGSDRWLIRKLSQANDAGAVKGQRRLWQALAHMAQPDLNASSSSASARPCSLVSQPPIVEIDRSAFGRKVRDFMAMKSNTSPPEYSDFVSSKAARTAMVARLGGGTQDETDEARHCSYQLCRTSVRRFLWRASLRSGGRGDVGLRGCDAPDLRSYPPALPSVLAGRSAAKAPQKRLQPR